MEDVENKLEKSVKVRHFVLALLVVAVVFSLGIFVERFYFQSKTSPDNIIKPSVPPKFESSVLENGGIESGEVVGQTTFSFSRLNNVDGGSLFLKKQVVVYDYGHGLDNPFCNSGNYGFCVDTEVYIDAGEKEGIRNIDEIPVKLVWRPLLMEPIILDSLTLDSFKKRKDLHGGIMENIIWSFTSNLLDFKYIPGSNDFLFSVHLLEKDKSIVFRYNSISGKLEELITFSGGMVPDIRSFSPNNRLVSLEVYSCYRCGGHQPSTWLVALDSVDSGVKRKELGKVLEFSWQDTVNSANNLYDKYRYKNYLPEKCPPGADDVAVCHKNPNTLPFISESFSGR